MICSSIFYGKNYLLKTIRWISIQKKIKIIQFKCKSDTFLMTLGIRGLEFADYESGGSGVQKQIHILVVLLTY